MCVCAKSKGEGREQRHRRVSITLTPDGWQIELHCCRCCCWCCRVRCWCCCCILWSSPMRKVTGVGLKYGCPPGNSRFRNPARVPRRRAAAAGTEQGEGTQKQGRSTSNPSPSACPRLKVSSACPPGEPSLCKRVATAGGTEGGHLLATTGPAHRPRLCKRGAVNARPGGGAVRAPIRSPSTPEACPLSGVVPACPFGGPSLCKRTAPNGDTEGGHRRLRSTAGPTPRPPLCKRGAVNARPEGTVTLDSGVSPATCPSTGAHPKITRIGMMTTTVPGPGRPSAAVLRAAAAAAAAAAAPCRAQGCPRRRRARRRRRSARGATSSSQQSSRRRLRK